MIAELEQIPVLPAAFGPARQMAFVVDDIDVAIQNWQNRGVGPFLLTREVDPLTNATYRGARAAPVSVDIAFAYIGDMQLELIRLHGTTPSLYQEAKERGMDGVHHYAVCVDDFPGVYLQALADGFTPVVDAGIDGLARMSYLESPDGTYIIEMIEWNALTRPYFDAIAQRIAAAGPVETVVEFTLAQLTPKSAVARQLLRFLVNSVLGRITPTRGAHTRGTGT